VYGWSAFSPVTYILAAGIPSTPARPEFVSATDNSISLKMFPSVDSTGAFITHYVLEVDEGESDSDFTEVSSYLQTSFLMTHTLTYATDGIITGRIYTFRFKAVNEKGESEYSEYLSIAANQPPL
jgi:hypothetical protein